MNNTASTHGDRKGNNANTQGGAAYITQVAKSPGEPNLLEGIKKKINLDLETTNKSNLSDKNQSSWALNLRSSSHTGCRGGVKGGKNEIDK